MLRSAKLPSSPADEGRLPDARDAVHVDDCVLTPTDELLELRELVGPADE